MLRHLRASIRSPASSCCFDGLCKPKYSTFASPRLGGPLHVTRASLSAFGGGAPAVPLRRRSFTACPFGGLVFFWESVLPLQCSLLPEPPPFPCHFPLVYLSPLSDVPGAATPSLLPSTLPSCASTLPFLPVGWAYSCSFSAPATVHFLHIVPVVLSACGLLPLSLLLHSHSRPSISFPPPEFLPSAPPLPSILCPPLPLVRGSHTLFFFLPRISSLLASLFSGDFELLSPLPTLIHHHYLHCCPLVRFFLGFSSSSLEAATTETLPGVFWLSSCSPPPLSS